MERNPPVQQLVQIAGSIQDQLQALRIQRLSDLQQQIETFIGNFDRLHVIRRKVNICIEHSWRAAANRLAEEAGTILRNLPYVTTGLEQAVKVLDAQVPSLRELSAELKQAEEEFGETQFNKQEQVLSVTTEPIELEEVYLGEFEIQLHLVGLAQGRLSSAYHIVALDPHPSSCDDSVTHPHVRDERLCAGDAAAAICQALSTGRICDFFVLVRSVLTSSNRNSPYVALDAWEGIPCYDCGYTVGADQSYFCSGCEHDYCEECSSYCRRCEEPFCHGCLQECVACEDAFCGACLTTCANCSRLLCQSCLEEGECPCHGEEDNDEPEEDEVRREEGVAGITVDQDITGQEASGEVAREGAVG